VPVSGLSTASWFSIAESRIIGGVVAVLVGLGFVLPAVAQWRTQGPLPAMSFVLLLLGVCLSLGGGWGVLAGVRQPRG
jgi:hypothetical protein